MPQNMPKGTRSTRRSADSYGSGGAKPKGVKKATYKSGGLYSTGRAITPAPGTKARRKWRDSDTKTGSNNFGKNTKHACQASECNIIPASQEC
jgi:hypothetical protein